ncbi:MAG: nucleotidyltransferase domain-containing protein, partial [Anaerolineales bacterium]|nr:nucleotidyltransferase domain-containing protein [Anaerolineales bacterium]
MVSMPFIPPTKKQLQPIAKKYGLRFIVLFGSVARGKVHEDSDIDVGVYTEKPITFNNRLKLWLELSKLLHADIDLAVLNHPNPLFGF